MESGDTGGVTVHSAILIKAKERYLTGGHEPGWKAVPTNDPEVQDAANHAVKSIQKRSNSLSPYELLEVLLAKAKVIEDYARFELLVKLRRGIKEEKFRVEVNKYIEGKFFLNQFEQDHS
uniref:Cystatin domain-containing protein n=1 Tax=Quercus lobata TaxID=97700 RepID=A0A7N2M3I5_QUELO